MTVWKDCTSYQRGEARVPRAWELRVLGLRIVVLTGHRACPDLWVMHCDPWFDTREIGLSDKAPAEDAQRVALAMVVHKIDSIAAALKAVQG